MAELVLMQKGEATMNVPSAKFAEYLAAGWREISRVSVESAAPAVVEVPEADEAEDVDDAAPKKPRGKK